MHGFVFYKNIINFVWAMDIPITYIPIGAKKVIDKKNLIK